MPRFNTEEQFKFLISCIRYSNNGRIDFDEVARECGIVSKGAAAKRYERMMKAHSIGIDMSNTDSAAEEPVATPRKKRKRGPAETDAAEGETENDSPEKICGNRENNDTDGSRIKQEATPAPNFVDGSFDLLGDISSESSPYNNDSAKPDTDLMVQPTGSSIKEEPQ